ncbi:uncharacterized protein VICG_01409 [Vittaforma corneae ATCC 50505]|uniref:Uncharacterized protein n=1 Tax=Vittaforma corneae (strain ATCC 50505) TaxID=993615 RepID=L2GM21_VITCO|nr:uncharacterized protein VICG_01409 [Vittaforma corneae ATCC 50505]ELA41545.1 hypothetical protein VICG_01409 [Vittaforma corneae ATCC 50505]
MPGMFKIAESFELDKTIKNKGMLNVYKHMLMQKKVTNSSLKNFLMIIYFLYYRISLELGLGELTTTEAVIVDIFLLMIVFSLVNQGSRFIFGMLVKSINFVREALWIYQHLEQIREMRH